MLRVRPSIPPCLGYKFRKGRYGYLCVKIVVKNIRKEVFIAMAVPGKGTDTRIALSSVKTVQCVYKKEHPK